MTANRKDINQIEKRNWFDAHSNALLTTHQPTTS